MKIKKMLKMLKEATEKHASKYSEEELTYMNEQLQIIEDEIKKLQHKDYKGFANK